MSASLYEIVMLANGEVVLQRSDDESEALVRIAFSDDAKYFLKDATLDIAQAMIDTGIQVMERMDAEGLEPTEIRFHDEIHPRILH